MWSCQSVVDLNIGPWAWGPGLCLSLIRILFSLTHHYRIGISILWRQFNRISIRPKKHFDFLIFEIDFLRRAISKPRQIIFAPSGGEILIGRLRIVFGVIVKLEIKFKNKIRLETLILNWKLQCEYGNNVINLETLILAWKLHHWLENFWIVFPI